MFGQVTLTQHPKQDAILDAVSKRARHPQKLRNPSLLTKGATIVTPRFGGRTIYLWVKNKTRTWVDKTSVWITRATFPRSFMSGTLLQAEMYRGEPSGDAPGQWVIAFEDVLISDGVVIADTIPFIRRQDRLIQLVTQLQRYADPAYDPGVFAVKPWFPSCKITTELCAEKYLKQPSYLLIRFLQRNPKSTKPDMGLSKDPFFMRIQHDTTTSSTTSSTHTTSPEGVIFLIRKTPDTTDPDQYDLIHPSKGTHEGHACVRTLHNSLWLRSMADNSKVWCRWLKEHTRYEPYAEASAMPNFKPSSSSSRPSHPPSHPSHSPRPSHHSSSRPPHSPRSSHHSPRNQRGYSKNVTCMLV